MSIQEQGDLEDLENLLLKIQNNLEKIKDDFDKDMICKIEFEEQTQKLRTELQKVQESIDKLED